MSLKLQILMALLGCAAVKAQCPDEGLEHGQSRCTNCLYYMTCTGNVTVTEACPAGTTCHQDGVTRAVCDPYLVCVTCPAGSLTACDPFDPYLVDACVPGQVPILFQTCDSTLDEICQNGACVTSSTGPSGTPYQQCADALALGTDPAIITYMPECTSGLLCSAGVVVSSIECTEGQYFDPRTSKCQSLPVNNCVGFGDGKAPSRTDCTKFAVCQGCVQEAEFDCDPGFVFDEVVNECVDSTTGNYTCGGDLVGCTFGSEGPCWNSRLSNYSLSVGH